jgi:hypothetical protein
VKVGEILPLDVEALYGTIISNPSCTSAQKRTYNIIKPQILRIIELILIPLMGQNSLYLILLLVLRIRIDVIARARFVRVEFFEISNIIEVIRDFASTRGYTDFVPR